MNATQALTNLSSDEEKKIIDEVAEDTLDVLKKKAAGFDFFLRKSKQLERGVIACILGSETQSLRFNADDLKDAGNYELEINQLVTGTILLTTKRK